MEEEKNKPLNIYQRINAVMADLDYIVKESKKVNGQYRFVSHDAVTAAVHPMLVKHGITLIPSMEEIERNGNKTTVKMKMSFVNIHDPKDRVSLSFWGEGVDNQDKAIGKAVSYAVKYCLLKIFCLETGDDVERDSINHQEETLSEEQVETVRFLCDGRQHLIDKVLSRCPGQKLEKFPASRYQSLIEWLRQQVGQATEVEATK